MSSDFHTEFTSDALPSLSFPHSEGPIEICCKPPFLLKVFKTFTEVVDGADEITYGPSFTTNFITSLLTMYL